MQSKMLCVSDGRTDTVNYRNSFGHCVTDTMWLSTVLIFITGKNSLCTFMGYLSNFFDNLDAIRTGLGGSLVRRGLEDIEDDLTSSTDGNYAAITWLVPITGLNRMSNITKILIKYNFSGPYAHCLSITLAYYINSKSMLVYPWEPYIVNYSSICKIAYSR